jgi:predicted nucleic acid-binding protein
LSAAYVDSSFLVAILFGEAGAATLRRIAGRFDPIVASDLLVAEVLAAAAREQVDPDPVAAALEDLDLVLPSRSLVPEMREILAVGRVRGADLWQLACALFVAGPAREDMAFLSRDAPQRRLARRLGFRTP